MICRDDAAVIDVPQLVKRYLTERPTAAQPVSFGTSGHRGTSLDNTFTDAHIAAICAAIVEYRTAHDIDGPLFLGRDTHALSEAAYATAIEVFAAHDVAIVVDDFSSFTPTPVISHAILTHNRLRTGRADGVVITPSHNPPEDGGFKYNPPSGGPADTDVTRVIQQRANELLERGAEFIRRIPLVRAQTYRTDLGGQYISDLRHVLDMDVIRGAQLKIGADPMGGAALDYWDMIAEEYGFAIDVVNTTVDPTFAFMPRDHDGRIRMDCSSPHAMANLIGLGASYDVAFGNDPDADRHGIVTPSAGLMNPNHYLAVAVDYLLRNRPEWSGSAGIGKTLVSSSIIDRIVADAGRPLVEVPVGFKWFVDGLVSGSILFGGEESAGASFVRKDGTAWSTDKDGILLALLAAEITARTGRDPGTHYRDLEQRFGAPVYARIDAPATPEQKQKLAQLSPEAVKADELAGERITARLTRAPGNDAPIGGLKVTTENGWFAARPSGTENVYKIYAESFVGGDHLGMIQEEAKGIVAEALEQT